MHFGDYTFIFLLALVLFGPKKLPEIGRQLGKLLAEFRRASNEFKFQIQEELRNMEDEERRKKAAELEAARPPADASPPTEQATLPASEGPSILPPSTGSSVTASRPFAVSAPPDAIGGSFGPPETDLKVDPPLPAEASSMPLAELHEAFDHPAPVEHEVAPGASENGAHPTAEEAAVHHD